MKKILLMLAVAAWLTACNDSVESDASGAAETVDAKVDSVEPSAAAGPDSKAAKIDTSISPVVDTTK